jgi:hypothetical protein
MTSLVQPSTSSSSGSSSSSNASNDNIGSSSARTAEILQQRGRERLQHIRDVLADRQRLAANRLATSRRELAQSNSDFRSTMARRRLEALGGFSGVTTRTRSRQIPTEELNSSSSSSNSSLVSISSASSEDVAIVDEPPRRRRRLNTLSSSD